MIGLVIVDNTAYWRVYLEQNVKERLCHHYEIEIVQKLMPSLMSRNEPFRESTISPKFRNPLLIYCLAYLSQTGHESIPRKDNITIVCTLLTSGQYSSTARGGFLFAEK